MKQAQVTVIVDMMRTLLLQDVCDRNSSGSQVHVW
jgi:hypothetical protein